MQKKAIFIFFFLFLFFGVFHSCTYENYFPTKKIFCISGRDYPTFPIENNLSLEFNYSLSFGFDNLVLTKKNKKNVLIGVEVTGNTELDRKVSFYEFNPQLKRFDYLGTFTNGFIEDVDNDGNYEIIYQSYFPNSLIIKDNLVYQYSLRHNETLLWVKDSIAITSLSINESYLNLSIYSLSNPAHITKTLEFTLEKNKLKDFFVYNNNLYILYNYQWYKVESANLSEWTPEIGYLRLKRFNTYVTPSFSSSQPSYIHFLGLAFSYENFFYFFLDPAFSISTFNNQTLIFIERYNYDSNSQRLEIYDIKRNLIRFFDNVSFFALNNYRLFLVKEKSVYYTDDLQHLYLLFNCSNFIKEIYLYDYDNDGKSEIEILDNEGRVYLYNEKSIPDVDYYIQKVSFPEPYTSYSSYFNITVCLGGSINTFFNLTVTVENNNTKIPVTIKFLDQILGVGECKDYTINYIPYKAGNITVNAILEVNDKNKENNKLVVKKDAKHDYWFVSRDFNYTGDKLGEKGFLMIDENDDLKDGYEKFILKNISNCSYRKVDYNNDNISEYLVDCVYEEDYYKLLDPLKKEVYNVKLVKDEDFSFYVGLINNTSFFVILPWYGYKGYISNISSTIYGNLLKIDYNLDKISDFSIFSSTLNILRGDKEVEDFNYLTTNLKIDNPLVAVSLNGFSFVKTLSFELLYKGLFNRSGVVEINYLGNKAEIPITNNYTVFYKIPLQMTPISSFTILNLNFDLNKTKFSDSSIQIFYPFQYNTTDDNITLKLCNLAIEDVNLDNNFLKIKEKNNCNNVLKKHVIIKDKEGNILVDKFFNSSTYDLSNLPLRRKYFFFVYYDDILDKDYTDNKREIVYNLEKIIHFNLKTENISMYQNNSILFSLNCDKNISLDLKVKCGLIEKNITFNCSNEEKSFSLDVFPFNKFECVFDILNNTYNISIVKKKNFNFIFPPAKEKIKIGNKEVILLEIGNETKALVNNKEIVDINYVNIDKNDFKAEIYGEQGKLNIYNIEIPDYLQFIKVNVGQPYDITKESHKIIVRTFASKINIETKALTQLTNEQKKKMGVKKETEVVGGNESFRKNVQLIVLTIFILALLLTISLSIYLIYVHIYLKEKKKKEQQQKMEYYYQIHKQKEEELLKKQREELRKRKEKIIEEEAKKLVSWIKFLLEVYDENEIYNYLIKKGYKKEVVDKAFELLKKGKF